MAAAAKPTVPKPDMNLPFVTVHLEYDQEYPWEWEGEWQFLDFNLRHRNSCSAYELLPPAIGLRRKLDCGTAYLLENNRERWWLGANWDWYAFHDYLPSGLLLWQEAPRSLGKTREERRQHAAGLMEEYSLYCSGEVFWLQVNILEDDGEELDCCSGILGAEAAVEAVLQAVGAHPVWEITGEPGESWARYGDLPFQLWSRLDDTVAEAALGSCFA